MESLVLVAGERSGDLLGGGLLRALGDRYPGLRCGGIAGPEMQAAGCEPWYPVEALSVMGLVEVLAHLPRLLHIRRNLLRRLLDRPPSVFVGIDAPDFNLPLERRLKAAGIPTVHYVSPTIWAWRRYRAPRLATAADRVLTLFPFEARFLAAAGVAATFVGHPLADRIPPAPRPMAEYRAELGLAPDRRWIALLPGSRRSEVERLIVPFLQALRWCGRRAADLAVVIPVARPDLEPVIRAAAERVDPGLPLRLLPGRARAAMGAAEAVLLASGTATLEAMLLKRPMVVAYRLASLTHALVRPLVKVPWVALPNLLAEAPLVPEFIQRLDPGQLGRALLRVLEPDADRERLLARFDEIHVQLRRGADQRAAAAVAEVAGHD